MSRPLRIEFPGAFYHIMARGNARLPIFEDDDDRKVFFTLLVEFVDRFHCLCHAYCLMDNHYHLLIETVEANLSRAMRHLNGVYTQWFNRRHDRVGHLFQGRYKASLVQQGSYLLELCRYIVLNPVRAKAVKNVGEYAWSSYQATAGFSGKPPFLTVDWVLSQFGEMQKEAQDGYRQFIDAGLKAHVPWKGLKNEFILGDEGFVESIKPALKDKSKIKEIVRRERLAFRPSLEELFQGEKGKIKGKDRDGVICAAHRNYGYTLSEIGNYLDLHYTTVSKIIKNSMKRDE